MRICLISREFPPDTGWGGVGAYTYQTSRALARKGHDVEVIALHRQGLQNADNSRTQNDDGVIVNRVAWESEMDELNLLLVAAPSSHYVIKSGIALWKRFLEIHRDDPFDVVEAPEHLAGAVYQSSTKICPLLITLHTPHSKFVSQNFHNVTPSFDNQLICMLERLSILTADVVASPSRDLAAFVSNDCGIPIESIEHIRNPVDTSTFAPDGPQTLPSGENVRIMFVGRLEHRKGVQDLARAIPLVLDSSDKVEFVFVGGDTDTAPGGTSMKDFIVSLLGDSIDRVTFIPHVELSRMPDLYRSADICVIPSLYDNAPYTCIEALSTGVPVIVSSAGGTKEYVKEGETGHIVPANSPQELADAIATLANDRAARARVGTNARSFALRYLDIETYAQEKLRLYEMARSRFKETRQTQLYMPAPEQSLEDTLEVLCSFDTMIFDTCYAMSFDFRLRYWLRLFRKRPRLASAKLLVALSNKIGIDTSKNPILRRLTDLINSKSTAQYENTRRWMKIDQDTIKEEVQESQRATSVGHPH